jgi:hypothetical protein
MANSSQIYREAREARRVFEEALGRTAAAAVPVAPFGQSGSGPL